MIYTADSYTSIEAMRRGPIVAGNALGSGLALGAAAAVDPQSSPAIAEAVRWNRRNRWNPLSALTSASLTRALENFERGDLREAALLWHAIAQRDDTIPGVKGKREMAVAHKPLQTIALEKSDDADAHRTVLEDFWRNVRYVNAWDRSDTGGVRKLIRRMQEAVSFRYAVHHVIWRPVRKTGRPGDAETGRRTKGWTLRATFEQVPLWFFETREARLRFLPSTLGTDGMEIDEENWLVSTGQGLMIAASVAYYCKRATLQDWLRFSEKFSIPGVLGHTSAARGSDQGEAMRAAVAAFGNDWAAVIYGADGNSKIEPIQVNGNPTAMPMPALIERVDRKIAALYRGADLSTMSSGSQSEGSGASLQGDETDLLERDDAASRSEELQTIERRVIAWHFGHGVEPLARTEIVAPEREDQTLLLAAVKQFVDMGARLPKADLLGRFGLAEAEADEAAFGDLETGDAGDLETGDAGDAGDAGDGEMADAERDAAGNAFDPSQPRNPKGRDDGGEWTDNPEFRGEWRPKSDGKKGKGIEWAENPGSRVQAPLSYGNDYLISHREGLHSVSYRPEGKHIPLGNFKTKEEARAAAERDWKLRQSETPEESNRRVQREAEEARVADETEWKKWKEKNLRDAAKEEKDDRVSYEKSPAEFLKERQSDAEKFAGHRADKADKKWLEAWEGNQRIAHRNELKAAAEYGKPLNSEAVEAYKMALPDGYRKDGNRYVFSVPGEKIPSIERLDRKWTAGPGGGNGDTEEKSIAEMSLADFTKSAEWEKHAFPGVDPRVLHRAHYFQALAKGDPVSSDAKRRYGVPDWAKGKVKIAGNAATGTAPDAETNLLASAAHLLAEAGASDRAWLAEDLRRVLALALAGDDVDETRRELMALRERLVDGVALTAAQEAAWERITLAALAEGAGEDPADAMMAGNGFDPNQPRQPAGSDRGGEFAAKPLDHGELNTPLAGRGITDAQIDRHLAEQQRDREEKTKSARRAAAGPKAEAREIFDRIGKDYAKHMGKKMGKPASEVFNAMKSLIWQSPEKMLPVLQKIESEREWEKPNS